MINSTIRCDTRGQQMWTCLLTLIYIYIYLMVHKNEAPATIWDDIQECLREPDRVYKPDPGIVMVL